jgi:hypothetical protein
VIPRRTRSSSHEAQVRKCCQIALEPIAAEMRHAAGQRNRQPEQFGLIAKNRYVVHNAWVLAGTRIPVFEQRRQPAA